MTKKEKINYVVGDICTAPRFGEKSTFKFLSIDRENDKLVGLWKGDKEPKEMSISIIEPGMLGMCRKENIGLICRKKNAEAILYSDEKYYFTIGFLTKNCKIVVRVTPKTENKFVNDYVGIKDDYPYNMDGYEVDTCVNTWGNVIRIVFDTKNINSFSSFSFPNEPVDGSGEHELLINNLDWGMELLSIGFDIGRNHNIDEIRNNIPEQHIKNFEEGLIYE